MRKKIWGIPVLAIILSLIISAGALATFLFFQAVPSTITVLGEGVAVYSDNACTIPLTELSFEDTGRSSNSSTEDMYIKSESDPGYLVYCALSTENLSSGLSLFANGNAVSTTPTAIGDNLTAGEVLHIELMVAVGDIDKASLSWNTNVHSRSTPY